MFMNRLVSQIASVFFTIVIVLTLTIPDGTQALVQEPKQASPLPLVNGQKNLIVSNDNISPSLAINPVLRWHTFYGSTSGVDTGYAIAVDDNSGDIILVGTSQSSWNGPNGATPLNAYAGNYDIVVIKLSNTGSYKWHTFYGSMTANDYAWDVVVDGNSDIVLVGTSTAEWNAADGTAPLNTFSGRSGFSDDIVVLKLSSSGSYKWHTFYGADGQDNGKELVVDTSGNVIVVGYSSHTWSGPLEMAPLNAHLGAGLAQIVILKLTSAGSYQWHTFYGSSTFTSLGFGITEDITGNYFVTGSSYGPWNGPGEVAPVNAYADSGDIVIVKLSNIGTYQWHTFLGSTSGQDVAYKIGMDQNQDVVLVGYSNAAWNGPGNVAPLAAYSGNSDIVIAKISRAGVYQWHSFYGSTSIDNGNGLVITCSGDMFLVGHSVLSWNGPGATAPLNAHTPGQYDVVVTKFNNLGVYQWHTFYGSSASDYGWGITSDKDGNAFTIGQSNASWNGPASAAALNPHSGGADILSIKLNSENSTTTRYVTPAGTDSCNCSNPISPCKTLSYAISKSNAGDTLEIAAGTYTEAGIMLNKDLILNGAGADTTIVQAAASPGTASDRVFFINNGVNVTISGLTIQNGNVIGDTGQQGSPYVAGGLGRNAYGGCVFNNGGTINLIDLAFSNCSVTGGKGGDGVDYYYLSIPFTGGVGWDATSGGQGGVGFGGAIYSISGVLNLTNSSLNGNSASGGQGGNGGSGYPNPSSGTGGYAWGGGIYVQSGTSVTMTNVTFSSNIARGGSSGSQGGYGIGGAIVSLTSTMVNNGTITNNQAIGGTGSSPGLGVPGGIFSGGAVSLRNTIVANNLGGNCDLTLISGGNNLENTNVCGFNAVGDLTNIDPNLGLLQNNGGTTLTRVLLPSSPAIDAGNNATCADTDQRGISRPVGDSCDIGAYEAGIMAPTITPTITLTSTTTSTPTPTSTAIGTPTSTPTLIQAQTVTLTATQTPTPTSAPTSAILTSTLSSINVNDGWVLESGENTSIGGSLNSTTATFNIGDNGTNRQYRGFLHFDTSGLPDTAVVTSVTLRIRQQGLMGTNPFTTHGSLLADICKPYFGITAALVVSDFQAASPCQSAVATFGSTPVLGWYSATLNSSWYSEIDPTGSAQFRLRFTLDDNNDAGADYLRFYSGNAVASTNYPQLIVQYYVP